MRPLRLVPLGLALAAFVGPAGAGAQSQPRPAPIELSMQLEFALGPGASRCPANAVELLHREVRRRVGYDPFLPNSAAIPAGRLKVVLARPPAGNGLLATFEYFNAAGVGHGPQKWDEEGSDAPACSGVVVGIAVYLAGKMVLDEPPEPPPAPAPPKEPAPAPPSATQMESASPATVEPTHSDKRRNPALPVAVVA
jgi:hypothetical protein